MKRSLLIGALAVLAYPALAAFPFSFWSPPRSGTVTVAAPDPNPIARTYASDGDTNGVFYFIGQNLSTAGAWTNPYTAGRIALTISGGPNQGTVTMLVDRTSNHVDTSNVASSWFVFDLGAGRSLICDKLSFRFRPDDLNYTPTGWLLEGSNDNSAWTTLLTVSGQTPGLGTWVSSTVTGSTGYRYFRLKQNGTNVNGTSFFVVNEVELYGSLTY